MNKALLSVLNDSERLLVAETDKGALDLLDEDAAVELHTRIRRARNKYVGLYRRQASAGVSRHGGRGKSRPKNTNAAAKAEVFEEALSSVSRRVAVLARESAAALRDERIAAARAAKAGQKPAAAGGKVTAGSRSGSKRRSVTQAKSGDASLRSPASEKNRAGTKSLGKRRQAKKDGR